MTAADEAEQPPAPHFPVFVLTPRALEQVRLVLQNQEGGAYCLEVSAQPAGCKELEYELGLVQAPTAEQLCWQQEDIRLCVGRDSVRYLLGASLDFVESEAEAGFKFSNPYMGPGCDCGLPKSGQC
ncbi:MAG: iron-sulfur cluster assembly accessory protein [Proteobacteria bacterium]|nr:iron-sulfur cluster assembly accessory protein [Cystobacterineae bacterium]MCL2258858.1 iron-sulfur cluster assembly accessory protein [Cystobacterineae bacterium]MCL2314834.1 iron-sulfur cluster assembly accessory protein [Pseudomonadota bacterium]